MELNKRLKELSCRFHRIGSLEEYQEWKRDTIILISTIEDKDTDVYMDGDKVTRKITKKQKEQSKYSSPSLVMV